MLPCPHRTDRLTDEEVDGVWGPGRHGPGNNLFVFVDVPAGHHLELSAEMEMLHDDRGTSAARRWEPGAEQRQPLGRPAREVAPHDRSELSRVWLHPPGRSVLA
jgi:hypothetical protein